MKILNVLIAFMLVSFATNVLAYGSSSSKKACAKPRLTQFTPAHLSSVTTQSEFSFLASSSTNPDSISVNAKGHAVEVEITKVNKGYSVTGKLPASLQGSYARINIEVTGTNKCKAKDGWLLKIEN